jgi:mycothiol synthase
MDLRTGYAFRSPTHDDLDAVAAVLLADQREDSPDPVLDAHFVREVWSRPGFDLSADAWVVIDDAETIVAYGQIQREEPGVVGSWGTVHPAHRGRGIGTCVLDRIEARAAELLEGAPSPRFRHSVSAADGAAVAMVRDRGLHPIRHFWHMQIDLAGPIEPGPPPGGIEIGGIDPPDDLPFVHAVLDAGFAEDPDPGPGPYDAWVEEETTSPSFDPTLWLLARDGEAVVGTLVAGAGDDGGWVQWLAVLASHRGRGIGTALLRRSFAAFADRGLRRATLNVDAENVTGATAVYERAGMRVVFRWDLWERAGA